MKIKMKILFALTLLAIITQVFCTVKKVTDNLSRNKLRSFSVFKGKHIGELVRINELHEILRQEIKRQKELEIHRRLEEQRQKIFKEQLMWRANGSSILKDFINRF